MDKAIEIASESFKSNSCDIPVGCVIVKDGEILSAASNTRERDIRISGHAEINAIEEASQKLGTYHLSGCKIFVTLEPCPMCASAISAAKIDELYFGAFNLREGAAGTVYNMLSSKVKIFPGIKKSDCESLLKKFFISIRK